MIVMYSGLVLQCICINKTTIFDEAANVLVTCLSKQTIDMINNAVVTLNLRTFQLNFASVFDTDGYLKSLDFQKQKLREESTKWIWLNAYYDSVKLFVTLAQGIVEKGRM